MRPHGIQDKAIEKFLFLTSKVRLHCDFTSPEFPGLGHVLFLTSKVRLHCDGMMVVLDSIWNTVPFPDLKGQTPLRHAIHKSDGVKDKLRFS